MAFILSLKNYRHLYLVNGEKSGIGFWKLGITIFDDPLKLDNKHFLECYRKNSLEVSTAKKVSDAIFLNIKNLLRDCKKDGFSLEIPTVGFSYDLPLNIVEDIYDFWLAMSSSNQKEWRKCIGLLKCHQRISLSDPILGKSFLKNSAKWASEIERLHSYRPMLPLNYDFARKEPMWE